MSNADPLSSELSFSRNLMTSFIQISAVAILVGYCLMVVGPFIGIVLWGIVLSVAIYPLHVKLAGVLGGNEKIAATIITVIGLLVLLLPGWLITDSAISTVVQLSSKISAGTLVVPPPNESVAGWPLIGEQLYSAWNTGSTNLQSFMEEYQAQVRQIGEWLLGSAGSLLIGLLHFTASFIIAGVCLLYARSGYETSNAIFDRVTPNRGQHITDLAIATIRSVTNGVLGVAAIQAVLAGLGFMVAGVPAAGVFTVVILVSAIVQVPAILIMVPLIVWVFSFAEPLTASLFAIYSIVVALSDNVLKPILLGRGVDLPVLVVLLGAIGGMIKFGVIGLFLGAVILGLGYQIISDWVWPNKSDPETADDA
jgi:predicted PurR-regulated permease PerM